MKYSFVETVSDGKDDMPYKYRRIREGPRSVKTGYYTLICKLKSEYHMSQSQAEGAVVLTANYLEEIGKFSNLIKSLIKYMYSITDSISWKFWKTW